MLRMPKFSSVLNATTDQHLPMDVTCLDGKLNNTVGETVQQCKDTRIDARAPAEAQPDAYARDDYVSPAPARTAHTDARALVEARPDAYARWSQLTLTLFSSHFLF